MFLAGCSPCCRWQAHVMSLEQQGKQTFHLTGPGADQDPQGLFSIAAETGVVSVSRSLDREASDSYQVVLEADPEADPVVDPEADPEADPEVDPEVDPEADPEVDPEADPVVDPVVDPEADPEVDPEADPVVDPVVDPEADPEVDPEADPVVDPVADPEVDPEADPVVDPEADPEVDPDVLDWFLGLSLIQFPCCVRGEEEAPAVPSVLYGSLMEGSSPNMELIWCA
ncbi:unnamed protein product [Boreogadus saida]